MKIEVIDPVPAPFAGEKPDLHLRHGPGTHCSLWWNDVPPVEGKRVGCVGHFTAAEPDTPLVIEALERLRQAGCTLAIGPMNGNTWRSYRFVTGGSAAPPFFLEPANPAFYPEMFRKVGFKALARYRSSVVDLPESPVRTRVEERMARRGITVRPLRQAEFRAELERIYELSLEAFRENLLYTPVDREGFLALYDGIEPFLAPEFVLFAEAGGGAVAFVFAVPDLAEERRTGATRTLVVKTLATLPAWRRFGIGSVLVGRVHEQARRMGFERAIHALQLDTNLSSKITRRCEGRPMREYTLFSRDLR